MNCIVDPRLMNAEFARRFNEKDLPALLAMYEPHAIHFNGRHDRYDTGPAAIGCALGELLELPGRMESRNHFCVVAQELAMLRADWASGPAMAPSSPRAARWRWRGARPTAAGRA